MKPTVHQYALIALLLGGVAISGCSSTPSAEPVEEPVAQTEPAPVFVPGAQWAFSADEPP